VHAPIGLDIGGEKPGEIAISILAQIIAHRHGKLPNKEGTF
jgi:xanthine dehydrogenase accessory factor